MLVVIGVWVGGRTEWGREVEDEMGKKTLKWCILEGSGSMWT